MEEIETKDNKILVSHFNVRQSISILVLRLVLIDIISAIFFLAIFSSDISFILEEVLKSYKILAFLLLVVFKVGLTIFSVLQWLNEYWEITTEKVIHRRGVIYKTEQTFSLDRAREIKVEQGFLGELLNFGTIVLFDIRLNRNMNLYLIHNPRRYLKIFEGIIPDLEEEKDIALKHSANKED